VICLPVVPSWEFQRREALTRRTELLLQQAEAGEMNKNALSVNEVKIWCYTSNTRE